MKYRYMMPTVGLTLLCAGMAPVIQAEISGGRVSDLRTSDLQFSGQQEIGLEQAIIRVRQDTGGQVLDAHSREEGERKVHVIKVLTPQGHIRLVPVDAHTGELLIRD